jgi:hypothetical protein
MFRAAVSARPEIVSITSFNEWGEVRVLSGPGLVRAAVLRMLGFCCGAGHADRAGGAVQ